MSAAATAVDASGAAEFSSGPFYTYMREAYDSMVIFRGMASSRFWIYVKEDEVFQDAGVIESCRKLSAFAATFVRKLSASGFSTSESAYKHVAVASLSQPFVKEALEASAEPKAVARAARLILACVAHAMDGVFDDTADNANVTRIVSLFFFLNIITCTDVEKDGSFRYVAKREKAEQQCGNKILLDTILLDYGFTTLCKVFEDREEVLEANLVKEKHLLPTLLVALQSLKLALDPVRLKYNSDKETVFTCTARWAHLASAISYSFILGDIVDELFEVDWTNNSPLLSSLLRLSNVFSPEYVEALHAQSPSLGTASCAFMYDVYLRKAATDYFVNYITGYLAHIDDFEACRGAAPYASAEMMDSLAMYCQWRLLDAVAVVGDVELYKRLTSSFKHIKASEHLVRGLQRAAEEAGRELWTGKEAEESTVLHLGVMLPAFIMRSVGRAELQRKPHIWLVSSVFEVFMEAFDFAMHYPSYKITAVNSFCQLIHWVGSCDAGAKLQEKLISQTRVLSILADVFKHCEKTLPDIVLAAVEGEKLASYTCGFKEACLALGYLCRANLHASDVAVDEIAPILVRIAHALLNSKAGMWRWEEEMKMTLGNTFGCLMVMCNASFEVYSKFPGVQDRTTRVLQKLNKGFDEGFSSAFFSVYVQNFPSGFEAGIGGADERQLAFPYHFQANLEYFAYEDFRRRIQDPGTRDQALELRPQVLEQALSTVRSDRNRGHILALHEEFGEDGRYSILESSITERIQCSALLESAKNLPPTELEIRYCIAMLQFVATTTTKWLAGQGESLPSLRPIEGPREVGACLCCWAPFQSHRLLAAEFTIVLERLDECVNKEAFWPIAAPVIMSLEDELVGVTRLVASSKPVLNRYLRDLDDRKSGIGGAFWDIGSRRIAKILSTASKRFESVAVGTKEEQEEAQAAADAAAAALLAELEAEEQQSKAEGSKKKEKRQKQKEKEKAAKEAAAAEEKARKEAEEAAKREAEEQRRAAEEAALEKQRRKEEKRAAEKAAQEAAQREQERLEQEARELKKKLEAEKKREKRLAKKLAAMESEKEMDESDASTPPLPSILPLPHEIVHLPPAPEAVPQPAAFPTPAAAESPEQPEDLQMLLSMLLPGFEESDAAGPSAPAAAPASKPSVLVPRALPPHSPLAVCVAQPEKWQALERLLRCPVSGVPLFDPVVDTDGESYDKSAASGGARPNFALRQLLQELCGG